MQPMGHVQLIRNLIDYDLNPQQAVDAPRWYITGTGDTQSSRDMLNSGVVLETGYGEDKQDSIEEALRATGHRVETAISGEKRSLFGRAQVIIQYDQTKAKWAGSDPRCDGCAMPQI